jgi:hypothetical protein
VPITARQIITIKKFNSMFFLRIGHIIYYICPVIQPKYIDFRGYSW